MDFQRKSKELLDATLELDALAVAEAIERIHESFVPAIQQIKDRDYVQAVGNHTGDILLVGISYDKKSKKHRCMIEKYRYGQLSGPGI